MCQQRNGMKKHVRTGVRAHKDLSLTPRTTLRRKKPRQYVPSVMVHIYNLSLGDAELGRSLGLHSQPGTCGKLKASKRSCLKNTMAFEEWHLRLSSYLPPTYVFSTHTHINTHMRARTLTCIKDEHHSTQSAHIGHKLCKSLGDRAKSDENMNLALVLCWTDIFLCLLFSLDAFLCEMNVIKLNRKD